MHKSWLQPYVQSTSETFLPSIWSCTLLQHFRTIQKVCINYKGQSISNEAFLITFCVLMVIQMKYIYWLSRKFSFHAQKTKNILGLFMVRGYIQYGRHTSRLLRLGTKSNYQIFIGWECETIEELVWNAEIICFKLYVKSALLQMGANLQGWPPNITDEPARILAKIQDQGWEVLRSPPYSPNLAPSDFYLVGPLKEHLWGTHFKTDQKV